MFTRTDSLGARTLVTDALGSTVALTDGSGAVKTNYAYEPYGNTTASGEANSNASQYTGRENDGSGLYYYRNRYYSPATARFISQDPIGLAGGVNLYAYVDGNPISLIDPTGEFGIPGAIAGGIIGGISGGMGAAATGGSVWRGALFGAATGALVGGTGAWIGASLPGQMALRAAAGGISNLLGQMQGIGDPCFKGLNGGAVAGSIVGGALGGVLAPGAWGTSFPGSVASQVGQRALAGIPGAGVSGTVGLVGNQLGK